MENYEIKVTKNGPYLVSGNISITKEIIASDKDGYPIKYITEKHYKDKKTYALCRCGKSKNNPYCDNTHTKISFDGTETASKEKHLLQKKKTSGPELILDDFPELCASARFCTRAGGVRELTKHSDDTESKKIAIQEVCNCPSGSLEISNNKTGKLIEPDLKPSISILEGPDKKVSGPIRVKGFIPIESSDKNLYETRNRVTLCRCGKSDNKPFCTGNHIASGFVDDNNVTNG
jgi:CDGSH-type Zn-finger protein